MDPIVVEALHPSAVIHVPRGSRKPRLDLVATRSPVSVRTLHLSEAEMLRPNDARLLDWPFGQGPNPTAVYRLPDGGRGLWAPLRNHEYDHVGHRDFLKALAGDPYEIGERQPLMAWGTPLRARSRYLHPSPNDGREARGIEVDLDASRSIERDDRARAGAAVARYVADTFRVLPGHDLVLVRLAVAIHGFGGWPFRGVVDEGEARFRMEHHHQLVSGAWDCDAVVAFASEDGGNAKTPRLAEQWVGLAGRDDAGHGARIAADNLPSRLRRIALQCAEHRAAAGDRDGVVGFRTLAETLQSREIDGLTGLHGLAEWHEVEETLRLVAVTAQAISDFGEVRAARPPERELTALEAAHGMVAVIEGAYLPCIPPPPVHEEDVEALGAMAP